MNATPNAVRESPTKKIRYRFVISLLSMFFCSGFVKVGYLAFVLSGAAISRVAMVVWIIGLFCPVSLIKQLFPFLSAFSA